jgi:hypothetical protein
VAARASALHRLVFVDETGTTTKIPRLRGRATKGERLNSKAPFGHWGTQTFVAGLRCDGLTAPWVIDAAMNRDIFETYVETQLAPVLQPGGVVILDNLSSHKSERAAYPSSQQVEQRVGIKAAQLSLTFMSSQQKHRLLQSSSELRQTLRPWRPSGDPDR